MFKKTLACWGLLLMAGAAVLAQPQPPAAGVIPSAACGTVVDLLTPPHATTRYSWTAGQLANSGSDSNPAAPIAAILLIGGGGWLDIDAAGCPRRLNGNILVRSAPRWQAAGVTTVLVDARSDWSGDDGLAGFRLHSEHAHDLGRVIADVRARTGAKTVWLIGHSRGTLSAANAAARLRGVDAPDGVVLASPMLVGDNSKRKPWVAQTVMDVDWKGFAGSLLLVGHAADNCLRSPPLRLDAVSQAVPAAARQQVVRVTGGPRQEGRAPSLSACEVHEPHDFVDQDGVFADGVLRFMHGGLF